MTESRKDVVRCYAKYVYLDVVQFSNRSAEAQSEIVQRLNEIVLDVLSRHAINVNENIFIPTGDGMCLALTDPNLAYDIHIQVALGILDSVAKNNEASEKKTRKFQVRIGINQNTDILITDINGRKNIAGAGINLASRIMDKADGGQILVSQAVYHELQPSELYMDKFKEFDASGKHGIRFQVHQYSDESPGLNVKTPEAFASRRYPSLSEETAHYFAQAIIHAEDLVKLKASRKGYWDGAAIVLLQLLAGDSCRVLNAIGYSGVLSKNKENAARMTFQEQYDHYASQDRWVLDQAKEHILSGLKRYPECFGHGGAGIQYEAISREGIKRLKDEWPLIWYCFELNHLGPWPR